MPARIPNAIVYWRLRRRRKARELARILDLSVSRVSELETGAILPSAHEVRRIARFLRVAPEDLYAEPLLTQILEAPASPRGRQSA